MEAAYEPIGHPSRTNTLELAIDHNAVLLETSGDWKYIDYRTKIKTEQALLGLVKNWFVRKFSQHIFISAEFSYTHTTSYPYNLK